jgi:hypothetical protein
MVYFIVSSSLVLSIVYTMTIIFWLGRIYLDSSKIKLMSKAAYCLLVGYIIQFILFSFYAILAFRNNHWMLGIIIFISSLSPYIIGRLGKDFNNVKFYIYLQLSIYSIDLLIVAFQKNLLS